MHNWLTIELVLAVLLVTSFTCVGLVALWAATSPRHWFLRTAVVLALAAPFLLVPAYELFLGPVLATGIVCLATVVRRQRTDSKSLAKSILESVPRKFSLASALLATAVLAMLIAVTAPVRITSTAWLLLSTGALMSGMTAYLTSLAADRSSKWWHRLVCVTVAVEMYFGLAMFGVFFVVFIDVWLTTSSATTASRLGFWGGASLIAASLLYIGVVLMNRATALGIVASPPRAASLRQHSTRTRLGFAAFLVLVAAPPLVVSWQLLHPLPILDDSIPTPNGYDRLIALGKRLQNSALIREYTADPIDYDKLAAAVAGQSRDFDELREILLLPTWIPVYYDVELHFADIDRTIAPRQIARALAAKMEVALRKGDIEDATASYSDTLHLSSVSHRGGLAIDFLIATASEEMAHEHMYRAISSLNQNQCETVRQQTASCEIGRRGIGDVLYRERVWMQRAHGWIGHLAELLSRFAPHENPNWNFRHGVLRTHCRTQAIARLLMLELALRAYHLDHGVAPTDLDELVPWYIADVPIDPFDDQQRPIRYVRNGSRYVCYSVGHDGTDDGGQPMSEGEFWAIHWNGTGDLRLDDYFAQVKPGGDGSAGNDSNEQAEIATDANG